MTRTLITILIVLLATSCGGGGDDPAPPASIPPPVPSPPPASPAPPADPLATTQEAHRLLQQATFGPTPEDIEDVQAVGVEAWIDSQLLVPASLQLPYMDGLPSPENNFQGQVNRLDAWFRHAINGEDQLRQRVAFALSEIMVVSENGVLANSPNGLAYYYDLLAQNAFGNFRNLMEVVTLSPAMGRYLSMLGNQKPNETLNIRPDENYAREMLQLFTIGLVQLNPDGTTIRDAGDQPLPTFDQATIEGFAHVFTGWTFANSESFDRPSFNHRRPMQPFEEFHATGPKTLLNGVVLPAGQTARQDLEDALDNIFAHTNVAPFISRQLIQRLVSANPSPGFVERVASVFNDDGTGTKGNLAAVIKAIFLDNEAREPAQAGTAGKLTEPLLRLVAVWRAFDAEAANGRYLFPRPENAFAQAPLRAPSVFNFFSPFYSPVGEINDLGLVSPEMQITNETTTASVNNYLAFAIFVRNSSAPNPAEDAILIDISEVSALATDPEALVEFVANRLLAGQISSELRQETIAMVNRWPIGASRAAEAIYTIAASPEFAVQP